MNNTEKIKVCIVDDEKSYRNVIKGIITKDSRIHIYHEFDNGQSFLNMLKGPFKPDVCLIDIKLPDISGMDCCRMAKEKNPNIHTIILTAYPDPETESLAKKLGVDYIEKGTRGEDLIDKIISSKSRNLHQDTITILKNEKEIDISGLLKTLANFMEKLNGLPKRQAEVMKYKLLKKSEEQISELLGISPNTVKEHYKRGKEKLDIPNLWEYVRLF